MGGGGGGGGVREGVPGFASFKDGFVALPDCFQPGFLSETHPFMAIVNRGQFVLE